MAPKLQRSLCAVLGAIGLALLVMMIVMESEPGALPLALLLVAALGEAHGRWRGRARRQR
jgi:hypothetical protein